MFIAKKMRKMCSKIIALGDTIVATGNTIVATASWIMSQQTVCIDVTTFNDFPWVFNSLCVFFLMNWSNLIRVNRIGKNDFIAKCCDVRWFFFIMISNHRNPHANKKKTSSTKNSLIKSTTVFIIRLLWKSLQCITFF